jgi:hypothetical protein
MTLLLYLTVITIRFFRVFFARDDTPLQTGISLCCDSLISIALYFFVFEMFAVREQLESHDSREYRRRTKRNNKLRAVIMGFAIVYAAVHTYFRINIDLDEGISLIESILYIPIFSIKLILDFVAVVIFYICFKFFYRQKLKALSKYHEKLTRFNRFIIVTVAILYGLRIVGSMYDFAISIVSITFTRNVLDQVFLVGEVAVHLRDFVEVLMFSYLFFFQSQRKYVCSVQTDKYQ